MRGGPPRRWSPEIEVEIARRYEAGENSKVLGRIYQASPTVILRVCRRNGADIRKPGQPRSRDEHPRWRGGLRQDGRGYWLRWVDSDDPYISMAHAGGHYVPLHRYVMAQSLGRCLTAQESVHHINGDPADNRIENLQLRGTVNHGQGQVRVCGDCGSRNVVCVELD